MNVTKFIMMSVFGTIALAFSSCDSNDDFSAGDVSGEIGKYVMALGVSSSSSTSYYLITATDLMTGVLSPIGNGIEQTGYRDFQQGAQTIFSIGGLGVNDVNGFTMDAAGKLQKRGNFTFTSSLNGFEQVDQSTMLGVEFPKTPQGGDAFKFYTVDINNVAVTRTVSHPVFQLGEKVTAENWPSFTGMRISDNKVYVTYYLMHPVTYATTETDEVFVAVYSYPELELISRTTDSRTGPAGSFNTNCGIIKDEQGDMYTMSACAKANGYTQSTKPAGFLRIKKGATSFDDSYYFNIEEITGGLKPAHIKYIGNGLVFAEVSTLKEQIDIWADSDLKLCIIDLYNKTVKDVQGAPVHNGQGSRSFTALVQGNDVYLPITLADGTYIYRTDVSQAVAQKGAKVQTTFVGGLFKLD